MSSSNSEKQAADRDFGTPPESGSSVTPKTIEDTATKGEETLNDTPAVAKKIMKPPKPLKDEAAQILEANNKKKKKSAAKQKVRVVVSSSEESDGESDDETEGSDTSSKSSSDDKRKQHKGKSKEKLKLLKKKEKKSAKSKQKKHRKSKKIVSETDSDDLDSACDTDDTSTTDSQTSDASDEESDLESPEEELAKLKTLVKLQAQQLNQLKLSVPPPADTAAHALKLVSSLSRKRQLRALGIDATGKKTKPDSKNPKEKVKAKAASKLDFKRVNQLWDKKTHQTKLVDTTEEADASFYDQYIFNVRRKFNFDGEYRETLIDIKSRLLKEALAEILDGVRGVSLAEESPSLNPNILFLYLEELREWRQTLRTKVKTAKKMKRKTKKKALLMVAHVKVMLKYLDKDFGKTKATLYPMLESNLITFELLWALFKPGTVAFTTTYGVIEEPRAFQIVYVEKEQSFQKGEWYYIEGKYLEYDGKSYGYGEMSIEIPAFTGSRKITSLAAYPLKYHKHAEKIQEQLIERGKKFVGLQGVQYKTMVGLAFQKRRKGQILKVNINGRVMVDPAIHRRINPNYQVSAVRTKDGDYLDESNASSEDDCACDSSETDDEDTKEGNGGLGNDDKVKTRTKVVLDDKKRAHIIDVEVNEAGDELHEEKLTEVVSQKVSDNCKNGEKPVPVFTDEEYLIASPVCLGFSFAEKLWLEFSVSGIQEIKWNVGAYESLVLETNTKEIVKALVESHKFHGSENIDDVIQGKGKGLVAVLHGPPGTGKTLTAEGISELLKAPLYMVTAGELGTDPKSLEIELQRILDIAHAWGAVLLLDEADVFLEKRTSQDIHRNALVSVFLRLLEYFQGILFLTTNRVETFDDAFQSRIHIALRYGDLSLKAKKAIFKIFLDLVRIQEGGVVDTFRESEIDRLAKHQLNGRQIKNTVRTAHALAVNKGEKLSMEHLKKVLDVAMSFDRDLRGGTGYEDAMKSYF